ncbi:MAG: disulfide bond formation regulator [Fluviicola sp.]|nr:MAG: disulfide bond formation regulator [Fluviicola sp.]
MKVNITRTNQNVLFKIENPTCESAFIDGSEEFGGVNGGMRPMEMLLASVATCSAFEVVRILKKQKQTITDFKIEVNGTRTKKGTSNPFSSIDILFLIRGQVELSKAERAVKISTEKYCSVRASLDPKIKVSHSVKVNE